MKRTPRKSRTLVRIPVEFQGISEDADIKGKGHTLDLNVNGCRVESQTPVPRGSYLRLRLTIPNAPKLVIIDMARVRWTQDKSFGVEFIQRSADDLPFINEVTASGGDQEQAIVQSIHDRTGKTPCTVLVVEDDPDLQYVLVRTLEGIGCKVLKASGSSEALKVCSAYVGPIHLLLVDLILRPTVFQLQGDGAQQPRVHGSELVDHLLRIVKKTHVIFMTGHNDSALHALGIDIRGALCLHKPFSREDLLAAVNRAMATAPLVWKERHHEKPARKTGTGR